MGIKIILLVSGLMGFLAGLSEDGGLGVSIVVFLLTAFGITFVIMAIILIFKSLGWLLGGASVSSYRLIRGDKM